MRSFITLVLLIVLNPVVLFADHISGGYIHYNCLGSGDYEVKIFVTRDCEGIANYANQTLTLSSATCNFSQDFTLNRTSESFLSYCGVTENETVCGSGNEFGYQEAVYTGVIFVPNECVDWKLSTELIAINSIDFINNTGNLTVETYFDNTGNFCGANQIFQDESFIFSCVNTTNSFESVAFDPDGNSGLEYNYSCPIIDGSTVINYNFANGSCTNPFPNNGSGFSLNQQNGNIDFSLNSVGKSMMTYEVIEYDNNGVVRSRTFRTLQILGISCSQVNEPSISGPFPFIQAESGTTCFTLTASSDNGISNFFLSGINNYEIVSETQQGNSTSYFICYTNTDVNCNSTITVPFQATAISDGDECYGLPSKTKTFTLIIEPTPPCKENLVVTNVNTSLPQAQQTPDMMTGLAYYGAENEIWVGDGGFPMQYLPAGITPGSVYFDFPVFFEAGTAVTLPSCQTGTSCANLTAGSTIRINPGHCSPQCIEPIEICANEVFECNGEKIDVLVKGGVPPFSAEIYIDGVFAGQESGLINHNENIPIEVDISDVVKTFDGNIQYNVVVTDASGEQFTTPYMPLVGTQRFYEPIENNMLPSSNDPSIFVYLINAIVRDYLPMVFYDDVNSGPPYYGATWFELLVFDRWGGLVLNLNKDIEETSTWSFDNGEIHWNGHFNNNFNQLCATTNTNGIDEVYPVILRARNCYNADVYEDCLIDLPPDPNECGFVLNNNCTTTVPWTPVTDALGNYFEYIYAGNFGDPSFDPGYICHQINNPSGMMINNQENKNNNLSKELYIEETSITKDVKTFSSRRQLNYSQEVVNSFAEIYISPNPFLKEVSINGFTSDIQSIRVFDTKQTLIKDVQPIQKHINLSNLESGVYVIVITMKDKQEKAFRIVKL